MLGSMADRIILSPPERRELQRMSRSRRVRAEDARRARIILSLASGFSLVFGLSAERSVAVSIRCGCGGTALKNSVCPDSGVGTVDVRPVKESRNSKLASSTGVCTASPLMVLPTGAAGSWGPRSALTICVWPGCGPRRGCSLTGLATTWSAMTPSSRRRRLLSSVSI